jgi:PTH1 family peptidyl-tRNA hydrolase
MKLVVGLGNPGRSYAKNRHNLGYMCVSHFARKHEIRFGRRQSKARVGLGVVDGKEVVLARPQTYMNLSGQSVGPLARRYAVSLDDLIVIYDDLDLPVGKIRIRRGGGSAGHKGIGSIVAELGNGDFIRIRVGIGRPDTSSEEDIISYVLGDFLPEEKTIVDEAVPVVGETILCLLTEGLAAAMNKYN